jgi:hypothetical protein
MKIEPVDYTTKTNFRPIVDRTKQSTAEDWNEVKRVTDALVGLLHVESGDVALEDGLTSFEIVFKDAFPDALYRVLGGVIVVYQIDGEEITEIAIKNIVRAVDKVTFETYNESSNYRVDYEIKVRS